MRANFRLVLCIAALMLIWTVTTLVPYLEPPTVRYENEPFPVDGPVRVGDPIPVHAARVNTSNEIIDVDFVRALVPVDPDGFTYPLVSGTTIALPGRMEAISTDGIVPLTARPGRYRVIGVISYRGTFRRHRVSYTSEIFDVVPRETDRPA